MKDTVKTNKFWWKDIFVSINNSYGDPFSKLQLENTLMKISRLKSSNMKFSVCTKAVLSDQSFDYLKKIGSIDKHNMFLQYSLTGLNEGGYSFKERENTIYKLYDQFGQMSIMFRPFISGRNDSIENIDRIIKIAAETGKVIIIGGLHDNNKRKFIDEKKYDEIINLCEKYSVTFHNKTSCAASSQFEIPCWVHHLGTPKNVDALKKLNYKFEILDNSVILNEATAGDLNFIRMLTGSRVGTYKLLNNYNILSCSSDRKYLECTSSWFSWSHNVPCEIACDYCIINNIEYLSGKNRFIGCFPADIIEYTNDSQNQILNLQNIGVKNDSKNPSIIFYDDIRTVQNCSNKQ